MIEIKGEWTNGGKIYAHVYVGAEFVGIVEVIDGGFIAGGKKKPVNTLSKAALQLVDRLIHAISIFTHSAKLLSDPDQ